MGRHHHKICATHRAGQISAAHDRKVEAAADQRLHQLRAALQTMISASKPYFFSRPRSLAAQTGVNSALRPGMPMRMFRRRLSG